LRRGFAVALLQALVHTNSLRSSGLRCTRSSPERACRC
jgi:hypothetical protein